MLLDISRINVALLVQMKTIKSIKYFVVDTLCYSVGIHKIVFLKYICTSLNLV